MGRTIHYNNQLYSTPVTVAGVQYYVDDGHELKRVLMWDGHSAFPGTYCVGAYDVYCCRCHMQVEKPPPPIVETQIIVRLKGNSLWVRCNFSELHRCGEWLTPLTKQEIHAARRTLLTIIDTLDREEV